MSYEDSRERKARAGRLFSPRTPIDTSELFSGRYSQVLKLNSVIAQAGAHAIIYGERGVGKTSLANIAPISFHVESKTPLERITAPRINCDGTDSYDALWRKVFSAIKVSEEGGPMGFLPDPAAQNVRSLLDGIVCGSFTPGEVLNVLAKVGSCCHLVITLDEFDRLPAGNVQRLMADTVKTLSDNKIQATLIIVGVGDSVGKLVEGHESVGRHLVEVPLPRMSREELEKIVSDRLPELGLTIADDALHCVSLVCAGLPYFTHLLGQHAVCAAIGKFSKQVTRSHVDATMKLAIEDSEREMKSAYYEATRSRHPKSKFHTTLAACALTQQDEFGYFMAANVREAFRQMADAGGTPDIPDFAKHLNRFCEKDKGGILECVGSKHQRRYRFDNPLMQPFVIIRSLDAQIITIDNIREF